MRRTAPFIWLITVLLLWLCAPPQASARRLPIKTYTTANGLARDHILCIVQDRQGFLWFCTAEGLSRFDGYEFKNYHIEQGLPTNTVSDFLETRAGAYYVATSGGLCRFEPANAPARFHCYAKEQIPHPVNLLYEDRSGTVWAAGDEMLLRLDAKSGLFKPVSLVILEPITVTALHEDRHGTLWVGTSVGLYRYDKLASATLYTRADGLPDDYVMGLVEDHNGALWVGTREGLGRLDDPAKPGRPSFRTFSVKDGLPARRVEDILETSKQILWVSTTEGLAEWLPAIDSGGEGRFQSYSLSQGLIAHTVGALAEDRDGNLWIGTFGSGLMKIARSGFSTYNADDNLQSAEAFIKGGDGATYILSRGPGRGTTLRRFDGRSFTTIRPAWPPKLIYHGWGRSQVAFESANGEWWISTGQGLARFAKGIGDNVPPTRIYTTRDGLAGDDIFRVFEDSRSNVWIGTIGPGGKDGFALWTRATGTIHAYRESEGLPHEPVPTAFAEDRAGDIWISMFHGGLLRKRPGATGFDFYPRTQLPGEIFTLYVDSRGRLWLGSSRGLIRVDEPSASTPAFVKFTTAQGLSSNSIQAVTEDRWGRLYLATGRGVDRFEPQPTGLGRMKHYTTADGITPGELNLAFEDTAGGIWFASPLGASRFIPTQDPPRPSPPVLLTGFSVGGVDQPISDLGQTALTGLRLPQTPLRIDFVGVDYSPGEALHYQYMLEGADPVWGPATDQRSVVYGSLAPGNYRFLVRALTSDGAVSPEPASIAFRVLPPVWRTWWFLSLCTLLIAALAFAFHRYRVAQVLAVANVRTHIATDLHDDIGTSLSQIAVLSEVALRTHNEPDESGATPLNQIAGISRELIDGMSDIVWAINPEHDHLDNLIYRMRRIATDLLQGQNIALQFSSPPAGQQDIRIGVDIRRHIYLIFKEGIHNIARHSGATKVEVALELTGERLVLRLTDNGKGFDPNQSYDGRGLLNIRKRAAAIGGVVEWKPAAADGGTTLRLTAPLSRSANPRRPLATLRGK